MEYFLHDYVFSSVYSPEGKNCVFLFRMRLLYPQILPQSPCCTSVYLQGPRTDEQQTPTPQEGVFHHRMVR